MSSHTILGRWYLAHALLVAAYPVVFLFAQNGSGQVSFDPLWPPLLLTLAVTAAVAVGLTVLMRDAVVASLLVTLAAVAVFGFGHAWNLAGAFLRSELVLLAIALALLVAGGAGVLSLRRRPRVAATAARALTVVAAVGVLANGLSAASIVLVGPALAGPLPAASTPAAAAAARPDIYYIILDRYADAQTLKSVYGFDNGPFLDALRERGFHVDDKSYANYLRTQLSLLSSLSMDYLDAEQLRAEAESPEGGNPLDSRLRGELAVPRQLKQVGYRYIHIGGEWEPTATNVDADVTMRYEGFSQFSIALFETTILGLLTPEVDPADEWSPPSLRAHSLYQLERLSEAADAPGPKYVFVHLLLPHPPYVFDTDGKMPTEAELNQRGNNESYVRQLQYTNRRILEIADTLLASGDPPVIVLQADEGPWPEGFRQQQEEFQWAEATDAELKEKLGILNAYHLPGSGAADALYAGISPVNSFRVIFNLYFGTNLPLLPDRHFAHVDARHFYDLFEITDRLE